MREGVSVIICCYNSTQRLRGTLSALASQRTNDISWEIVLVDNASTDNTRSAARDLWEAGNRPDVSMTIVEEVTAGLSFARKKGVESARFNTIIFCDDDNHFFPDYIAEAFSIITRNPQIGALGGIGIALSDELLPAWFEKYKFCFACYEQSDKDGELTDVLASLFGAGLVVRRDLLVKLYSLKYSYLLSDRSGSSLSSGGDTELSYTIRLLGYKLWFSSKLKFYHYLPKARLSEKYLLRINKSLSYSRGRLIVYKYVLSEKPVTEIVWLKDAFYQLRNFTASLITFLQISRPLFERKLGVGFSYNSMISILRQYGKYGSTYRDIIKLKEQAE
jgi:glycosyltransferase involved in cell wall biosynthesis